MLMKILVCGYDRLLPKDKHLKSAIDGVLSKIFHAGIENSIILLVSEKFDEWNYALPVSLTKVKSGVFPKLFEETRRKKKINEYARELKPDLLFSINEVLTPPGITELVWITQEIKKTGVFVKAKNILSFSDYLLRTIPGTVFKSTLPPQVSSFFRPVDWSHRESVKEQYSNGKEFFYYSAFNNPIGQVTNVLKAFSIFKKWQKSSVQLMIADLGSNADALRQLLENYKYRQDVMIMEDCNLEEEANIATSAFAVIYLPAIDVTGLRVLNYLQGELPVITNRTGAINETAGDAVLYCETNNIEDIASKMRNIYKDEKLRSQLIDKAGSVMADRLKEAEDAWNGFRSFFQSIRTDS